MLDVPSAGWAKAKTTFPPTSTAPGMVPAPRERSDAPDTRYIFSGSPNTNPSPTNCGEPLTGAFEINSGAENVFPLSVDDAW